MHFVSISQCFSPGSVVATVSFLFDESLLDPDPLIIAILGVALACFAFSSVPSWSISSASIEVHLELFLRYLLFDKIERTGVC